MFWGWLWVFGGSREGLGCLGGLRKGWGFVEGFLKGGSLEIGNVSDYQLINQSFIKFFTSIIEFLIK